MFRLCNNPGVRICFQGKIIPFRSQNNYSVELKFNESKCCESHGLVDLIRISRSFSVSASSVSATQELHKPRLSNSGSRKRANKLEIIRSRLKELHDLPEDGLTSQSGATRTNLEKKDERTIDSLDDVTEGDTNDIIDIVDDGSDTNFIRNISKPDRRRSDAYVDMTFGLARFDSMNKPKDYKLKKEKTNEKYESENVAVNTISMRQKTALRNSSSEITVGESAMKKTHLQSHHGVAANKPSLSQSPCTAEVQKSLFDEQYFEALLNNEEANMQSNAKISEATNFFDHQYFGDHLQDEPTACNIEEYALSRKSDLKQFLKTTQATNQQVSLKDLAEAHCRQISDSATKEVQSVVSHASKSTMEMKKNSNQLSDERNAISVHENLFDEQYFSVLLASKEEKCLATENEDASSSEHSTGNSAPNMFEEQFFKKQKHESAFSAKNQFMLTNSTKITKCQGIKKQPAELTMDYHSSLSSANDAGFPVETPTFRHDVSDKSCADFSAVTFQGNITEDTTFVEPVTRRELKSRTRPVANTENPETAYDYAMKLRFEKRHKQEFEDGKKKGDNMLPRESKWTGSVDSKGFRVLKDQVCDMQQLTQEEVVSILKDSIIYEDDKLLAIDKPYGLASHGGPGIHHSIGKLLAPLAHRIDKSGKIDTLHLVHRLDKETTGVMVLAKTLQVSEFLLAMFKKRQVIKHYWVITKGVPNPPEGIVDIPMMEGTVGGKYRMQLQPVKVDTDLGLRRVSTSSTSEAVTNYRVLSSYGSSALVECTPETGVKHQIRCHLAFALNTPILGDHKYSHFSKIAPQKLHPEILNLIGVRQAKVRHIPMHLHAKAVVLPEWLNGRNLFISARLPKHFVQNMKWLKLKPPG